MSSYKESFNEAAYNAYEEARELGISEERAKDIGDCAGNAALQEWTEQRQDAADNLRKARKEQGL